MSVAARIDERLIASLWERQAFDAEALQLLGLRVVYRGVPSDAGGPDYQDAILSDPSGALLRGDVEFHVTAADWYTHGHHQDARYNRVILHVVWNGEMETRRADGSMAPVLGLEGWSEVNRAALLQTPVLLVHPCVSAFARLDAASLAARVHRAGMIRFQQRAEHFQAELGELPADEVAYRALFEGMGYASNREAFRDLALIVPHGWLQSTPAAGRQATLLDAARLGPPARIPPPSHLPDGAWRLSRLRPGNHPAVRLAGIARLLEALGPRLAGALQEIVLNTVKPSDLRAALTVAGEAGVDEGGSSARPSSPIGSGRADELAVSAVLPLVSAMLYTEGATVSPAEELYTRYPSPPSNRWTRLMQDLLAQAGHQYTPRRAPEHQGLHHLYHEHCRPERREGCPVCGLS